MKSLFVKFVAAQALTVLFALLVVAVITRSSLHRGFAEFLEQQELSVLDRLTPALTELYEAQGSWDGLRARPAEWRRILAQSGGEQQPMRRLPPDRARPEGARRPPWRPPQGHLLRGLQDRQGLMLRERLFLLDEASGFVIGVRRPNPDPEALRPVEADGKIVGWVGFAPANIQLPPEAGRFLAGQRRVLGLSLLVGMGLALLSAFLLARHLSRPVSQLDETVAALAGGDFEKRAEVSTEDEIGRLARNVNQLAVGLQSSRSARQRWMADIAHELRTPVAVLKGEIEAVADGVRKADERMADSLREEIEQLSLLIDDLQSLALADAGALNLYREEVDFSDLVEQQGEAFLHRLAERDISLKTRLEPGIHLSADPQRLRQLLHNLLENCRRYTETGGWVRLTLEKTTEGASLKIEDSGPGVSDRELERLFDRFYRAEASRSRGTGGSGLGLSICHSIALAHDGGLEAGHSPLGGLCITLNLPG